MNYNYPFGNFYKAILGDSQNFLYYYGVMKSPANAILLKLRVNYEEVWSKVYETNCYHSAFDVDPSESYLYFAGAPSMYYLPLHKIDAKDGSVSSSSKISSFLSSSSHYSIKFPKSGDILYLTLTDPVSLSDPKSYGVI